MHSRLIRCLVLCSAVLLVVPSVWGQPVATTTGAISEATLTMTIMGTLGPVLSGSDPLGLNGENGTVIVQASEKLSPTKHTSNSATYTLPVGAITIKVGGEKFQSNTKSKMTITLTNTADILTLAATGPEGIKITATAYLQPKSWSKGVLKHPTSFNPSPQNLTAATKSNGPGSKLTYVYEGTTVLGLSGSISCSDPQSWQGEE